MYIKTNKLISLLFMLIFLFTVVPGKTEAHAYILKSSPAVNESLTAQPSQITIQFNETIQPGFHTLYLVNSSGKKIRLTSSGLNKEDPSILEAQIKGKLPKGSYSIQWKIVSADGHPVQGVIPFSVGPIKGKSGQAQASTTNYFPKADIIIQRWFLYISFSIFIGAVLFHLVYSSRQSDSSGKIQAKSKKWIWFSLALMSLGILLYLPLQTGVNANVSILQAMKPSLLMDTLGLTTTGRIWIIQMIFLIGLLFTTFFTTRSGNLSSLKEWAISILFLLGLMVTKSLTSHASGFEHEAIPVLMDFLHLLAASIWVGSLFAIIILLPRKISTQENTEYWKSIQSISFIAMISVVILVLTGLYGSFVNVPTVYSLINSYYGKTLMAKILLFMIMLALGAFHFWKGKKRGNKGISRTVSIEFLVGIMVLTLTTLLTNLSTAVTSPGPFNETEILENGNKVTLQISPNIEGINTFKIVIKDEDGKMNNDIQQVTATFKPLNVDLEDNTVTVPKKTSGVYQTEGMYVNIAGEWKVTIHILTKTLDSFDVPFQPLAGSQ